MKSYTEKSLIDIDRILASKPEEVELHGDRLSVTEVLAVARQNTPVSFTSDKSVMIRIQSCYEHMMDDVRNGVPIYGCNTGYGGQASHVLVDGTPDERVALARAISEGIAHVDVSSGPLFGKDIIRGAMVIRINMLMRGVSAIRLSDLDIYREMLNKQITPLVNQYGGIGASGDLAHNCRVLDAARQLPGTKVWDAQGNVMEAMAALPAAGIPQLMLEPKAGLGFVNGDNFSTSLALLLAVDTLHAILLTSIVNAMVIEVLRGTDRSFHPMLGSLRPHAGQQEAASLFRYLLQGSRLAYQEMAGHKKRDKGVSVQDAYSLRCLSQFQGVNIEKIKVYLDQITVNANSVSDNPLWVPDDMATEGEKPWQWVSGGNFIAMHMVEVLDGLRKSITQAVKLNDRHLARMVAKHANNGLPANLSDKSAVTQCAFKGVQIQSGMLEVYSMALSMPISTLFGVHEEGNQDVTAHSLTSGIMGIENLRLLRYSIAQNLLAVSQAVDLRGGPRLLSPHTKPMYELVRSKVPYITKEQPLHNEIEVLYDTIVSGEAVKVARSQVFSDYI